MGIFEIIHAYYPAFARGLCVTLQLAAITWIGGLAMGTMAGLLGHHSKKYFGNALKVFSFLLSGVPFLVLLFWAHYPLQELFQVVIDPFITAAAVLTIINTVGVADICRAALDNFPTEYVLAAQVCGLTRRQIARRIQFPLILRQVLPSLLNLQVSMLQMTLFASLISVEELFRVAQSINSRVHRTVEIYSGLAIFFLLICLPLNGIALWLKASFTRNISDR